ncbi:MarR family winged helix-turn-helix transcriptional regulator [Alteraurantiacibacter aquimixticola]|uniref:MarR family transcriptional regulator n=1 Tax=Alteraurantiacibacter aquimixticola TaxID=2489173 RepID=A0A4T3EZE7_9SPHN|nr:MarR family transcriptional regulator [Alteraurantiacibacter aquimixticola]TIX50132.1 MarR family transcriptional regulator [Alteraurantiacibacter aquimixticola]
MTLPEKADPVAEGPRAGPVAAWRKALIDHAIALRQHLLDESAGGGRRLEVSEARLAAIHEGLGPMASEALRIVEAYTIGSHSAEGEASSTEDVPAEFAARLNIIMNGIAPAAVPPTEGKRSPGVIQSELWQLLYKVRESAEMAYARELDLVELDRRILFLLHNVGPLVPAEISSAVGVDKAQVSRSVKRLLELKMIEREQLRAPLSLTRKGQGHSERLLRLAELRNRELTFDIGDAELESFFAVIEKLLDQAVRLYEQERELSSAQETREFPRPGAPVESESVGSGDRIVMDRSRIISPLMTLSSYFSRSGSLTFKRLTKLSNFEAWVLNEIGREPPIEWNALVDRLDRDHSQAGRTVNALVGRGLVVREGKPGRRHGQFSPSAEGQKLFELIQEASRQRSAFLLAPLSKDEREGFLATFDKIRRNAVVQLERERAFEDLGQR